MTLSNSEAKSLGSERGAKSKSITQVVLGSDGEEVFPVEVVLLGMQLEARFVIISEVSRLRPAACLVGESAGLESFLSTLRLPLVYLLFRLGGLGGLGGILAGGEGECGIRRLRLTARFLLFLHLCKRQRFWPGQFAGTHTIIFF